MIHAQNAMKPRRIHIIVLYNSAATLPGRQDEFASERATALAAAQAAQALTTAGFRVTLAQVRSNLLEVIVQLRRRRPEVVVNLCEGFRGYSAFEAQVAGLLELMGIPFTGNSSRSLGLCQDKFRAKAVLNAWGLPTPRGRLAKSDDDIPRGMGFPLIVKPNAEDASLGIGPRSVVCDRPALRRQIAWMVKRYGAPALIERYIDGREFNVALVEDTALRVLPISEVVFRDFPASAPRIVGYDAKWKAFCAEYQRTIPVCPASVPAKLAGQLHRLGLEACAALGVRGYARVDFRVDRRGRPFILEVNPNPDTSREAGWVQSLTAAGIAYEMFWKQQVQWVMNRAKVAGQRFPIGGKSRKSPVTCDRARKRRQ